MYITSKHSEYFREFNFLANVPFGKFAKDSEMLLFVVSLHLPVVSVMLFRIVTNCSNFVTSFISPTTICNDTTNSIISLTLVNLPNVN